MNESLNDSVANETYAKGDAFGNWLLFSHSEAKKDSEDSAAGYWSNTYGWCTRDLATRFTCTSCSIPASVGMDAMWVMEVRP